MRIVLGKTLHPQCPLGIELSSDKIRVSKAGGLALTAELSGGSLHEFAKIWHTNLSLVTEPEQRMWQATNTKTIDITATLPKHELKRRLVKCYKELADITSNDSGGWLKQYLANRSFLDSLSSFYTQHGGSKKRHSVKYTLANTVTGRLTVEEGASVLTATPEERARWRCDEGNPLFEIDISALEPTILFSQQLPDFDVGADLYTAVNNEWFAGELERDAVKKLTISLCYGASERSLVLGSGASKDQIRKLMQDLRLKSFSRQLRSQYDDLGWIYSLTGRPIFPKEKNPRPGVLINNCIQSTGVDVSIESFSTLINELGCTPHVVVHDAVYVSSDHELPQHATVKSDILKGRKIKCTVKRLEDV